MTEEELTTALAEVCGQLNVAHARLVSLVAEALETECWAGAGIHSCEQWVAWQTGLSPTRARQVVTTARRRAELPATWTAFESGELSVDQVAVVARHTPAAYEADVATFARSATVSQLQRTLRTYHFADEESAVIEPPDPIGVSGTFDDNGHYRLRAVMDPDDGAIVDAALREARDALFHGGELHVTWCDALVEVARRSLGTVSSLSRRDAFVALVHLPFDRPGAHLHGGPALADSLARQLLCDSSGAVVGLRQGKPVSVGRTQRIVPRHVRRLVEERDRGCRVPGCGHRHVEIHHIVHWLDGGRTDPANLLSTCRRHHRQHHQGVLGIAGDAELPDGLVFTDRRGRLLPASPPPPAPSLRTVVPGSSSWRHPTGEQLEAHWVDFSPIEPRAG